MLLCVAVRQRSCWTKLLSVHVFSGAAPGNFSNVLKIQLDRLPIDKVLCANLLAGLPYIVEVARMSTARFIFAGLPAASGPSPTSFGAGTGGFPTSRCTRWQHGAAPARLGSAQVGVDTGPHGQCEPDRVPSTLGLRDFGRVPDACASMGRAAGLHDLVTARKQWGASVTRVRRLSADRVGRTLQPASRPNMAARFVSEHGSPLRVRTWQPASRPLRVRAWQPASRPNMAARFVSADTLRL